MANTAIERVVIGHDREAAEMTGTTWPASAPQIKTPMRRPSADAIVPAQRADLFNLIAQNVSGFAIFAHDPNGRILSWNRGVGEVLGFVEDQFVDQNVSIIFTREDIENGVVDDQMREAADVGKARDRKWHVRRDGSRFWANGLLMPLWSDGELTGYVRIIRDDTDQKQIEDERNEILVREQKARQHAEALRASLERIQREKDEFLAVLAHELRNPLNTVLGWLAVLRSGMADQGLLVKGLRSIEASARAQNRIIEDVIDLSRIDSGCLKLSCEPMSLNEAIDQAMESLRPAACAKNITLEEALDTKRAIIFGDLDRIRQAIINILSNAVKFTHAGGRITLKLICSDLNARIIVEDNGKGFSSEFRSRIFERYAQADKSSVRARSGLGLGLPLVKEIIEKHGGTVTAESAGEGLGATFTVCLPLLRTTSAAAVANVKCLAAGSAS
jgi:PAS domain S-box-containing protein